MKSTDYFVISDKHDRLGSEVAKKLYSWILYNDTPISIQKTKKILAIADKHEKIYQHRAKIFMLKLTFAMIILYSISLIFK